MEDPFDLSPPSLFKKNREDDKQKTPKKWGIIAGISVGVFVFGTLALFAVSKPQIQADTISYSTLPKIAFSNLPNNLKSGEDFSLTVSVTNQGATTIRNGSLLISTSGSNLDKTIKLTNLKEGQEGYLRNLNETEKKRFEGGLSGGFYWYVGNLEPKQTKSQQIIGNATGLKVRIEGRMISSQEIESSCGFLNLATCKKQTPDQQIAFEAIDIAIKEVAKINLRSGYNFITLPYILTPVDATKLLSSFKDRYAYSFNPETGEYLSLYQEDNVNRIKPGYGIWIYGGTDQEVALPDNKSETNSNDSYSVKLASGWNHLGNPYSKRIILSAEKILVREIAEDGTESGTQYSLKSAVDAGVISQPYIVKSKNFTDSSGVQSDLTKVLEWKTVGYESTIEPFVGFLVRAEKRVALTFPGRNVIAPGDLLSIEEKDRISLWIRNGSLNEYGEPSSTVYSGGVPQDKNGNPVNRFDYILNKNPGRPWNR